MASERLGQPPDDAERNQVDTPSDLVFARSSLHQRSNYRLNFWDQPVRPSFPQLVQDDVWLARRFHCRTLGRCCKSKDGQQIDAPDHEMSHGLEFV